MPTISEHQTLIQTVLLTAEQEMDEFIQRGLESNSEDIEMDSPTDLSDSSSSRSSILSHHHHPSHPVHHLLLPHHHPPLVPHLEFKSQSQM